MADKREIKGRRVEEGVLFRDRILSIRTIVGAEEVANIPLTPEGAYGVVPVGIKVKSLSQDLVVWDIKIGKYSQIACVGQFSSRLLDGRLAFRLDEIKPMGMTLYVCLENKSDVPADVEVIVYLEEVLDSATKIMPCPVRLGEPGQANFAGRPQLGGELIGLLVHPDFGVAIATDAMSFRVIVHDYDGVNERPGTRRSIDVSPTATELGWLVPDKPMPIWVSENAVLEISGGGPRPAKETDFLFLLAPDFTGPMNRLDSPRYDGRVIR